MPEYENEDLKSEVIRLRDELGKASASLKESELEKNLYRDISESEDLNELLNALGRQLEAISDIDGYMINLADSERRALVCEKVCLSAEYKGIEKTYLKLKYSLNQDKTDPNVLAFKEARKVFVSISSDSNKFSREELGVYKRWKIHGLASIPIIYGMNKPIGTILIYSQTQDVANSAVELVEFCLSYFCRQLSKTMRVNELIKMEHSLKTALEEQKKFLEFVEKVNSLTKVDEVFKTFLHEMLRRFKFDMGSIFIEEQDQLKLKKTSALDDKYIETVRKVEEYFENVSFDISPFDGAIATAYCQKIHLIIPDVMEIRHLPMSKKDKHGLEAFETPRTFLFIPIKKGERMIGVLWLKSLTSIIEVSEDDVAVLKLLCRFLGTSVANANTYETVEVQKDEIGTLNRNLEQKVVELNDLATKDRLTDLYNFGYFQEELQRRIQEYKRCAGEHYLGLVICDIDHFKQFNDTYGHIAGNVALSEVAKRVSNSAREMDIVCRYGGEEFVIILPKCDVKGAQIVAERMRTAIMAEPIVIENESLTVTISAGCAGYIPEETMAQFIHRADAALYQAKELGRNRVEVAEE